MVKRESQSLFVWVIVALCSLGAVFAYAEDETPSDSTEQVSENTEKSAMSWPLEYIIQPFLNGLIYPVAKPMDYAIKNGIVEKSVELISFGEDYKIMIYPSFNFKPGSRTMVGANYLHRSVLFKRDYLVLQGE